MNRIKAWLRFVLGFSQTEANAFVILLPLMLLVISSSPVYRTFFLSGSPDVALESKRLDSLMATLDWGIDSSVNRKEVERFPFDPNTAPESTLVALGISTRVATSIGRYRAKGGRFRVKNDLAKIYGFDSSTFQNLHAFIQLPDSLPKNKPKPRIRPYTADDRKTKVPFNLNEADTTILKSIYGIGPTLARRIVLYRERLGGFLTQGQLYEVWGLDSTVVSRLQARSRIDPEFVPVQLPINHSTEQELAQHPYIRTKIARAIVNYRFQHGPFEHVDDLMKIATFDEKAFLRIKPYISLD